MENRLAPGVLIIGGGIQGLWLLDELRRQGHRALLLERRELGGEQTCHSHVYIHQGHMYNNYEGDLVGRLRLAGQMWADWLAARPDAPVEAPCSYFGFQNPADAQLKAAFWDTVGLKYDRLDRVPFPLAEGVIKFGMMSPERCINGEYLVRELARTNAEFISRIDRVERVELEEEGNIVSEVRVLFPGNVRVTFAPHALVFTAGMGNQALLDLTARGERAIHASLHDRQQLRRGHMLVIRGSDDTLFSPLRFAGVFPKLRGLFIAPRDADGRPVWLVSDNRSPTVIGADDFLLKDERDWLPDVRAALRMLSPYCFERTDGLSVGIYLAPKAEGRAESGGLPVEERIESPGRIRNLWAVWPSKLTLAPIASQEVIRRYTDYLAERPFIDAGIEQWKSIRVDVPTAPERWTVTPLLPWNEFFRCHGLAERGAV